MTPKYIHQKSRTMAPKRIFTGLIIILNITWAVKFQATASEEMPEDQHLQAVDFSPLSPLFRIYALQYYRHLSPKDEVVLGAAYTNIRWDLGCMPRIKRKVSGNTKLKNRFSTFRPCSSLE